MEKYFVNAAKPASYFEKRNHFDCLACARPIKNPLCHHCIGRGFMEWTRKFPNEERILCDKTRNFLATHRFFKGAGVRCISCKGKRTSICPRCFTEILYKYVREAGVGIREIVEFLFIFNFDFEHNESSQELDFLEGY